MLKSIRNSMIILKQQVSNKNITIINDKKEEADPKWVSLFLWCMVASSPFSP